MKHTRAILITILSVGLLAFLAGCGGGHADGGLAEGQTPDREFTFSALMTGYVGKGGDIDGEKNPVLTARKGEVVRINIVNGETMPHDIAMKAHNVKSRQIIQAGERASITFVASKDDEYYCTIPGHVQTGMIGTFKVVGEQVASTAP